MWSKLDNEADKLAAAAYVLESRGDSELAAALFAIAADVRAEARKARMKKW